jgi:hypothetical protein
LNPDLTSTAERRKELDQLQESLASRRSILHFAHSAVSLLVAMVLAGAAAKVFHDNQPPAMYFGLVPAGVSLGLVVYAVARYVLGRRDLALELQRFKSLEALRRTLHLDDPSALLPK